MKSITKVKKSAGFTLIELVIVVVILGFLAVTAIPKFIDLTEQAKQANIEGMAGGFATAVSLARAQWEAEGRQQDTNNRNFVDYDGSILLLTTEGTDIRPGYVVGLNDGVSLGGGFDATNCVNIWNNILQQPPRITDSITTLNDGSSMRYFASKSGTNSESLCHYYLKESLDNDANGAYEAPVNGSVSVGNSFTYAPASSAVTVYIKDNQL